MKQGFFVEVEKNVKYNGPHDSLSLARAEARALGPDLLIYHGILNEGEDGSLDTSELFLVPKTQK